MRHNLAENHIAQERQGRSAAFTLTELLVVIALTGLLLALILGPLVQGFRLTNRARALAEAQNATRFTLETLKRELSQAAYVFDNSNTPVVLPLDLPTPERDPAYYPVLNGNPNTRPQIAYAKIDFVPAATFGEGQGTAIDPTTNKPLGGTPIQVPVAPGTRIVRYFVGLRQNIPTGNATVAVYQNVYEFPRTDDDINPFILYRAEYDPRDPNLIDQTQTNPFGPGGLHDPNFFYNLNTANSSANLGYRVATGNGQSYAANWRAVSSPVLDVKNLDVLAWRRDAGRQIAQGNPFQLQVNFAPSAILSDTATPGFLSAASAESPTAVPSLYTAKYGQWTYPFTVTVFRGSTAAGSNRGNADPFGSIRFIVRQAIDPRPPFPTVLQVDMDDRRGTLGVNPNSHYWLQDPNTGKITIIVDRLAFALDPARGRVEAALPPIATQGGVPLFLPAGSSVVTQMAAGPGGTTGAGGNFGTLVETIFRQNTRDDDPAFDPDADYSENGVQYGRAAGLTFTNAKGTISLTNQGIGVAHLVEPRYFVAAPPIPSLASPGTSYESPFLAFGNGAPFRGILIVPGTEKVLGPDNNLSLDNSRAGNECLLVTYYRVPGTGSIAKSAGTLQTAPNVYSYQWSGLLNYQLLSDLDYYRDPILKFDEPPTRDSDNSAGLPARGLGDSRPQGELRVTYLWQNNYARDAAGQPINIYGEPTNTGLDANGLPINPTQGSKKPEPDVVKLDYATRSLINVTIGARVYDISTGSPQTSQVGDKITVGNVGR